MRIEGKAHWTKENEKLLKRGHCLVHVTYFSHFGTA